MQDAITAMRGNIANLDSSIAKSEREREGHQRWADQWSERIAAETSKRDQLIAAIAVLEASGTAHTVTVTSTAPISIQEG